MGTRRTAADILSAAGLKTVGLKTAMYSVNDIKKARYTVQVMAKILVKKTIMILVVLILITG